MPRGRPPIARTREEALKARREQVRKNVQAFRERKQAWVKVHEGRTDAGGDDYTFILEELGRSNDQDQRKKPPAGETASQHDNGKGDVELPSPILRRRQLPQLLPKTPKPSVICDLDPVGPLPPSVNSGPASLQQLTSTVVNNFCPDSALIGVHWFQIVPSFVNRNRTLDLSIQALCLLQVSHVDRNDYILQKSLSLYDVALRRLRSSLSQPVNRFRVEIFAATLALSSYELLQGTNSQERGWMLHLEGGTTYLNMFPALDVCALTDQLSFHFLETICIFDALGSRKPSCFSKSKWWRASVDRFGGEAYGPLLRMLTSLPGVLEQCDSAISLAPSAVTAEEWMRLLQLCLRLEDAFLDWSGRALGADMVADIHTARLYLLYWPSMILLYDSMTAILHRLSPNISMSDQVLVPTAQSIDAVSSAQAYTSSSDSFAMSILRSVPLCLDSKYGIIGKSIVLLPLYVARNHMQQTGKEDEAKRCGEWLERIGQKDMRFGLKVKKGL